MRCSKSVTPIVRVGSIVFVVLFPSLETFSEERRIVHHFNVEQMAELEIDAMCEVEGA